ncbi:MAG: CvpA family protein [Verrucomicrobiae bacterium]|nr:CvpA family protein [Verrucomicrobiae bacterium]
MKEILESISWFDFVVIGFLVAGILRGRKRGMSQELIDVFMWVGIVVGSALGYKLVGSLINQKTGLELLWSNVLGYFAIVLVLLIIESILDKLFHDMLVGSDIFGVLEYPLGMLSGAIRFLCMLLLMLALLNAKLVTDAERLAEIEKQKKELGKTYFPTLGEIQDSIFNKSISGKFIKNNLSWCLIQSVPSQTPPAVRRQNEKSIKDQKQRMIDSLTK